MLDPQRLKCALVTIIPTDRNAFKAACRASMQQRAVGIRQCVETKTRAQEHEAPGHFLKICCLRLRRWFAKGIIDTGTGQLSNSWIWCPVDYCLCQWSKDRRVMI